MNTADKIRSAISHFERARCFPPLKIDDLARIEVSMGIRIPNAYRVFLTEVSNGAELNQFLLYPGMLESHSKRELKRVWNSFQLNNDPVRSHWLSRDELAFSEFFVFGSDGHACFCLRYDNAKSVWMWEAGAGDIIELDYSFEAWLLESSRHSL